MGILDGLLGGGSRGGAVFAGEAVVKIIGNTDELVASIHGGLRRAGRLDAVSRGLTRGLTVPLLSAAGASVKLATDLDHSLRSVNSLFGLTGRAGQRNFLQISRTVRRLSDDLGVAQTELSQGLYQAISSGVPKRNAFTFMRTAAKAAIAGVTTTDVAVEGLTKTINAFGLDFGDAERVADSMFQTVNKGIVTFEELSNYMFQVAPAAAAAGVGLQETNAAITTLTLSGVPMAVAATRIQAFLTATARKAKDLDPIFSRLGDGSVQLALKQRGLQYVMDAVADAADGQQKKLVAMLGRVEAVQAVNILAGKSSKRFTQAIREQRDATGAANLAFDELEKSGARKFQRSMENVKNAAIDVGRTLMPLAVDIARSIGEWARSFSDLDRETQKMILVSLGFAAVLGPTIRLISNLVTVIKVAAKAMAFLAGSPLGLLLAGIGLLTYATLDAVGAFDKESESVRTLVDELKALKSIQDELETAPRDRRLARLDVEDARERQRQARERLDSLKKEGASTREIAQARRDLARSRIGTEDAEARFGEIEVRERALRLAERMEKIIIHQHRAQERQKEEIGRTVTKVKELSDGYRLGGRELREKLIASVENGKLSVQQLQAALDALPLHVRIQIDRVAVEYAAGAATYGGGRIPGPVLPPKTTKPPPPKKIGHVGLRIPGPINHEQLVLARGGERLVTRGQARGENQPLRILSGRLRLEDGYAYIEGVAEDVVDDQVATSQTVSRMHR